MHSNLSISGFLLFAGLGGIGTAAHYAVLIACVQFLGMRAVSASLLGYAIGALTNFVLSHHVAFRSGARVQETAPRFFTVAVSGFFLNGAVMWSLVDRLGLQYILAQIISTAVALGFNYFANAIWTFGGQRRGQ